MDIQPGDIILESGNDPLSFLIEKAGHCPYSHSEIVTAVEGNEIIVISAQPPSEMIWDLFQAKVLRVKVDLEQYYKYAVLRFDPPLNEAEREQIVQDAISQEGIIYDYGELFGFALGVEGDIFNQKARICSGTVAKACDRTRPLVVRIDPLLCMPRDIWTNVSLRLVYQKES